MFSEDGPAPGGSGSLWYFLCSALSVIRPVKITGVHTLKHADGTHSNNPKCRLLGHNENSGTSRLQGPAQMILNGIRTVSEPPEAIFFFFFAVTSPQTRTDISRSVLLGDTALV